MLSRQRSHLGWGFGLRLVGVALLASLAPMTPADAKQSVPGASRQLAVGDPAPDFSLEGSDGKTYRLSELRGKQVVVLAWFAKAFSGG